MKKLEKIIKQAPVYLHNWKSKLDVVADFEDIYITEEEYNAEVCPYNNEELWKENRIKLKEALDRYKDVNILFASYGQDNYTGEAFVLIEKEGKLFEINGGHCSCYGLEGQWEEEETTLEALERRLVEGSMGVDDYSGNEYAEELKQFLGIINK